jgi:hypothetical protein
MLAAAFTLFADSLTIAAETAEEVEPSKTAFYVLGGLAAVWAIVLFALGMRSSDFPGSAGAQRGVILVSVLLVLGAMASSVLTA